MTGVAALWDFDDPAGSEARFREAAAATDGEDRSVLLTQVARCLGLQDRFDEGHALLDTIRATSGEVSVRSALERGRLLNSAGRAEEALPWFHKAVEEAATAGLEALEIDALHMVALAAPAPERLVLNEQALARARSASDPAARDWDASLLNNIGMCHADDGDLDAALEAFEAALVARQRIGDDNLTRVARWMIAWVKRLQGRTAEALSEQRSLKAELDALGSSDPYVDEEIALLENPAEEEAP